VETALARRPVLAEEVDELVRAALWSNPASPPRPGLRDAVLTRARRAPELAAEHAVASYTGLSDRLGVLAAALPAELHDAETPNGLTAGQLVHHLAAQASLLAQVLGTPTVPEVTELDIDTRTAAFLALDHEVVDALGMWRTAVDASRGFVATHPGARAWWRGSEMPVTDLLLVHAFETWIHADDLSRISGQGPEIPDAGHLTPMADLAGRILGPSIEAGGLSRPGATGRLVLSGAGGGEWQVGFGTDGPNRFSDVVVTVDVVDWCRLVGDRMDADQLPHAVAGDDTLADAMIASASVFATL